MCKEHFKVCILIYTDGHCKTCSNCLKKRKGREGNIVKKERWRRGKVGKKENIKKKERGEDGRRGEKKI